MRQRVLVSLVLAFIAAGFVAASPTVAVEGSAVADSPLYKAWSNDYGKAGGDRNAAVTVSTSRVYVTEKIAAHGVVRVDLIGGDVAIELEGLDRAVDVWLLDNKPGPGKSILPEDGDVLLRLATVFPPKSGGSAHVSQSFGPDLFRGVEIDWILVSDAGVHPSESRLLFGSRHYFETLFTRERLAREGFAPEPSSFRMPPAAKAVAAPAPSAGPIFARVPDDILVDTGLVSPKVFKGGIIFFHETFEGNGRTCGTCHPQANNQTIDVPFIASLPDSDPLFIAEQNPPNDLDQLEIPELMRNFGLILENVDGLEDPTNKFLMRGVPHSLSLFTSISRPPGGANPPVDRTGWSGDGAPNPGSLREFLLGAIIQHLPKNSLARVFGTDFREPTNDELDLALEFQLAGGRLNDLNLLNVTLSETRANDGKETFRTSACNGCHTNAGANLAGFNDNRNTGVEMLANPAQGFMGITFPLDGGFGGQGLNAPNFDCDGDLVDDCFGDGTFNITPVVEAADTPPFFHNNVVQTVEGSVAFYIPTFVNFTLAQVNDVGAFMRVINAAFNFQIAIQRTKAAATIDPHTALVPSLLEFIRIRGTANTLLKLACAEIEDGIEVLGTSPLGPLNPGSIGRAELACRYIREAIPNTNLVKRLTAMEKAVELLSSANAGLGTGMNYQLGQGNLMF